MIIPAQKAGDSVYGVCGMGMYRFVIKFIYIAALILVFKAGRNYLKNHDYRNCLHRHARHRHQTRPRILGVGVRAASPQWVWTGPPPPRAPRQDRTRRGQ